MISRRPLVAMPRVGKPNAPLCCWACGQPWPSRYDLVIDATASNVRIDDRQPAPITRNELHVLSALIAAFPRWLSRTQLIEHAWDYRPDCDMPSSTSVSKAIKALGELLKGTRYTIENDQQRGVRLTDVDTILREMRLDEAINGVLHVKTLAKGLVAASRQVASKKRQPKPRHKSAAVRKKERSSAVYANNAAARRAKQAKNVKRRLETHV